MLRRRTRERQALVARAQQPVRVLTAQSNLVLNVLRGTVWPRSDPVNLVLAPSSHLRTGGLALVYRPIAIGSSYCINASPRLSCSLSPVHTCSFWLFPAGFTFYVKLCPRAGLGTRALCGARP